MRSNLLAAIALLLLAASPAVAQETVDAVGAGAVGASRLGFSYGGGRVAVDAAGNARPLDYPTVRVLAPASSAARNGLLVGDTIVSVNGRDARERPLFPDRRAGARYVLRVRRGNEEREITFVVEPSAAARPER